MNLYKEQKKIYKLIFTIFFQSKYVSNTHKKGTFDHNTSNEQFWIKWWNDFQTIKKRLEIQQDEKNVAINNFISNLPPQKSFPNSFNWVVNLSSRKLSRYDMDVLRRGLQFVPSPQIQSYELFRQKFDNFLQNLRQENFEKFVQCEAQIDQELQQIELPKSNMSETSRKALLHLMNDQSIKIMKADKGHQVVIMSSWDYDGRVQKLLNDNKLYQKLYFDPTVRYQICIQQVLYKMKKDSNLSQQFIDGLIVKKPQAPSIYCLPKIHKDDYPFRPIISSVNSPDYLLCKHISNVLQNLVASSPTIILNIQDFVEFVQQQKIQDNEVMVNFDVAGMFTNINVNKSIEIILEKLKYDITFQQNTPFSFTQFELLLRLTQNSTFFHFHGEFYEQLNCLPMGKPSSPAISNLFMQNFEKNIFKQCSDFPRVWKRYQDDIFTIIKTDQLETFLNKINQIDPNIKFVQELEQNGCLAFLDVMIFRNTDNTLSTKVFRRSGKQIIRTIDYDSYQDINIKKGLVKSLLIKAKKYCHDKGDREEENQFIKEILLKNNYPKQFFEQIQKQYEMQKIKHKKRKNSKKHTNRQNDQIVNIPYNQPLLKNLKKVENRFGIQIKSQKYDPLKKYFASRKLII
eukprot:TRINITY_DN2992_c0_g1_i2.p1 TRINITY_DN2992_c0_g1~~TRINITY_DN2992_c0_g1_i2.p1  ORF type:complete len:627 (+),score=-1.18 TRINITY_DN2992_c0_g1_i2:121-2001(+)